MLLCKIISRPRMISRSRKRPTTFLNFQISQKPRSIVYILMRIEHRLETRKFIAMKMMINLHTANINQFHTIFLSRSEMFDSFLQRRRKKGRTMQIEGVGLERASMPRLRQPHSI